MSSHGYQRKFWRRPRSRESQGGAEGSRPQTGFSTFTATSIKGELGLLNGTRIFAAGIIIIIHDGCYDYKNY